MCQWEQAYISLQQRAQHSIDNPGIFPSAILNEQGVHKPTLPHFTYDLLADDNLMIRKMDDIVLGCGVRAHFNSTADKWTEQVNISMVNNTIWSRAHLPLNIQERWKWILTQYDIEHMLWRYPSMYFVGHDKQAGVMGHYMPPHNPSLVLLTLDDLYKLEQKHLNQDGCIYASNKHMLSMLWKVGGEGNALNGAQAQLLCDVTLEMQCLQVLHRALNTSKQIQNGW